MLHNLNHFQFHLSSIFIIHVCYFAGIILIHSNQLSSQARRTNCCWTYLQSFSINFNLHFYNFEILNLHGILLVFSIRIILCPLPSQTGRANRGVMIFNHFIHCIKSGAFSYINSTSGMMNQTEQGGSVHLYFVTIRNFESRSSSAIRLGGRMLIQANLTNYSLLQHIYVEMLSKTAQNFQMSANLQS